MVLAFAILEIRTHNFISGQMVGFHLVQDNQILSLLAQFQTLSRTFQRIVSWGHGKIGTQELELTLGITFTTKRWGLHRTED